MQNLVGWRKVRGTSDPVGLDLVTFDTARPAESPLVLDPLGDRRWESLADRHPRASVFHTTAWLEVLHRTYGYRPVVYGFPSSSGELTSGLVFCEVQSWLTGRRLVSLPFSDHCEPLVEAPAELSELCAPAIQQAQNRLWRYVELRPVRIDLAKGIGQPSEHYVLHRLDLRPTIEVLRRNLHADSIRRKIQRAEREGLRVESGNSEALLADFYGLHITTRRRQAVPPHPLKWFRNILHCLGKSAALRVARNGKRAVAAVLTLEKGTTLVYKYGCSDQRFHNLGAMQLVYWDMICDAKSRGLLEVDMGRSDLDNEGLIAFKDKWGTQRQELSYVRYPAGSGGSGREIAHARTAKFLVSRSPDWLLAAVGNLLYPHAG